MNPLGSRRTKQLGRRREKQRAFAKAQGSWLETRMAMHLVWQTVYLWVQLNQLEHRIGASDGTVVVMDDGAKDGTNDGATDGSVDGDMDGESEVVSKILAM